MNLEDIRRLRDETGAGVMAAKRALEAAEGDYLIARKILRESATEIGR